jgi:hypothetical protein
LRYWTSHFGVHDLRAGTRRTVIALSHRPAMDVRGRPFGERCGDYLIERSPQWFVRRGRPLRLALHPDDLRRPGLHETTLGAIERALALGARPMTYVQLLDYYASCDAYREEAASESARAETDSPARQTAAAR